MMNPNRMATNYWQVSDELAIGATEKAGATSIMNALNRARFRRLTPEQIRQRGLRVRLYVRNPITRFASAFAYFAPNDNYPIQPSRAAWLLAEHPTLEQFTDAVLAGMENEHWSPQLAQHMPIDEVLRFENAADTFPVELPHMNKGRIEKPEITYRLDELEDYYREDLDAWEAAA